MIRKIKGELLLEKYEVTDDLADIEVLRRRGLITEIASGRVVCYGFDKFFNWNEKYAAPIDWTRPTYITEKIDDSNIRLYHYGDTWHIATLGNIDAADAPVGDNALNFADLVIRALGGETGFNTFTAYLDTNYTWIFELVSPENRVVIDYDETVLYYLGNRCNLKPYTENEIELPDECNKFVRHPRWFTPKSIDEAINIVSTFDATHEGLVVRDCNNHMVKIKGAEYLNAAHLGNNGKITLKRLLRMYRADMLDDFISGCPKYSDKAYAFLRAYELLAAHYDNLTIPNNRFDILAAPVQDKDFMFKKFDGKISTGKDYLDIMLEKRLIRMLEVIYASVCNSGN